MTNLADYWSEGNYLPEGDHEVAVKDCKFITYNSGNRGVEFILTDKRRREIKAAFALVNEGNLRVLASFVRACGLKKEECATYNPHELPSHQRLLGRVLNIKVVKEPGSNGKDYSKVGEWWLSDSPQAAPATQQNKPATAPKPETYPDGLADDDTF